MSALSASTPMATDLDTLFPIPTFSDGFSGSIIPIDIPTATLSPTITLPPPLAGPSPTFSYCPANSTDTSGCTITVWRYPVTWDQNLWEASTFTDAADYAAFTSSLESNFSAPCDATMSEFLGRCPTYAIETIKPTSVIQEYGYNITVTCCESSSEYVYALPRCTATATATIDQDVIDRMYNFVTVVPAAESLDELDPIVDRDVIGTNTCKTRYMPYHTPMARPFPITKTYVAVLSTQHGMGARPPPPSTTSPKLPPGEPTPAPVVQPGNNNPPPSKPPPPAGNNNPPPSKPPPAGNNNNPMPGAPGGQPGSPPQNSPPAQNTSPPNPGNGQSGAPGNSNPNPNPNPPAGAGAPGVLAPPGTPGNDGDGSGGQAGGSGGPNPNISPGQQPPLSSGGGEGGNVPTRPGESEGTGSTLPIPSPELTGAGSSAREQLYGYSSWIIVGLNMFFVLQAVL